VSPPQDFKQKEEKGGTCPRGGGEREVNHYGCLKKDERGDLEKKNGMKTRFCHGEKTMTSAVPERKKEVINRGKPGYMKSDASGRGGNRKRNGYRIRKITPYL